jgi:hypothetical protein
MTTTAHQPYLPRQRARSWCLLLISAVLQLTAAASAAAEEAPVDDAAYSRSIESALREYDLAHWSESRAFFAQAHALRPSARTLRGLTQAAFALRDYVAAIEYATQAVVNTTHPLTEELRLQMLALREDGRRLVAHVQLLSAPKAASVRVDKSNVALDPDGSLLLNPGTHRLLVQAQGFRAATRILQVESGETYTWDISLDPAEEAGPSTAERGARASQPASNAPWMLMGVSGAVAAAGAVLVALSASDIAKVEHAAVGSHWSAVEGANARAPVLSAVGFALLGAGVAGAATGIVWTLSGASSERDSSAAVRVMPGLGSIQLTGSF